MIDQILSVDHAFGQLELYVFGQDWPKAIRSTGNSVDKGPTKQIGGKRKRELETAHANVTVHTTYRWDISWFVSKQEGLFFSFQSFS